MPKNSTIYVYGALAGSNINNINVVDVLYHNKKVHGFFLPNWLE
jgi:hypothetical protein